MCCTNVDLSKAKVKNKEFVKNIINRVYEDELRREKFKPIYHLSIIVDKSGSIFSYGVNDDIPDGIVKSTHSEVNALRKLLSKPLDRTIFRKRLFMINVAVLYHGKIKLSKPCPYCQQFIKKNAPFIHRIYYTENEY